MLTTSSDDGYIGLEQADFKQTNADFVL